MHQPIDALTHSIDSMTALRDHLPIVPVHVLNGILTGVNECYLQRRWKAGLDHIASTGQAKLMEKALDVYEKLSAAGYIGQRKGS